MRIGERGTATPLVTAVMIGAVAVFLFSRGIFPEKATMLFVSEGNRFVQRTEDFSIIAMVDAGVPYNTVAARVRYTKDLVEVRGVSIRDSFVTLWVEEPDIRADDGIIEFGGGNPAPAVGRSAIVHITFHPVRTGEAVIEYENASVLAADGRGTELVGRLRDIAFNIREADLPSADVNDDNTVTFRDLSAVFSHIGSDNAAYDLNRDGKIDLSDVSIVAGRMFK